jgi:hypothetical protein
MLSAPIDNARPDHFASAMDFCLEAWFALAEWIVSSEVGRSRFKETAFRD